MRLAKGGSREDFVRMPPSSGGSPSTLAVQPRGKERRLAARAQAAAKESRAEQRAIEAEMLEPREERSRAALERRRARSLTKVAASVLQRPPSSRVRTTSSHRADCRGALHGFARECECSARSATCEPAGASSRSQGRDQCSVNCKLRATPEHQPGSNDFNAALILPGGINVEVS